jgi:acyl-CoA synthetase (NDP forming)
MTAAPLDAFFRARSVALVGATERSLWSNATYANFATLGFGGKVYPVNPKGGRVYDIAAAPTCAAIGEPVDAALLMVPVEAIPETFLDLERAGIRNAVILTSGFAEMGPEGAARQAELARLAKLSGITVLGPNCLGFINLVDRVPIWTIAIPTDQTGPVAIVSQSGALATYIAGYAGRQGIGLSYVVSTGNEADLNVARVAEHLADDPATKVIALFLETARDAVTLARAAEKVHAAGKAMVALKIGTSELTAKAAQAHTGSLIGDDRVFTAACDRLGIIRVPSIEDMVATAGMIAKVKPVTKRKVALLAISGGACEIASDRSDALGVPLAALSTETLGELRGILPPFATPSNPLDITGAAILKPALFAESIACLGRDPDVGMIACAFDVRDQAEDTFANMVATEIGRGMADVPMPSVMISVAPRIVTPENRRTAAQHGIPYFATGLHHGLVAIRNLLWWSERRERPARGLPAPIVPAAAAPLPQGERAVLDYLAGQGVPVIPARVVTSAADAAAAAEGQGGAVALKIASPDIAHKSDIGGVRLGVVGGAAAAQAFTAIMADVARARPDARRDGVIVSPMRTGGLELFIGMLRDPQWGPAITVGLGGVFVEVLQDTSVRLLPVTPADVLEMLAELRGTKLLDGYRGGQAVDRGRVAEIVACIGDAALALGPDLVALEINPLLARGDHVEALDGLAVWDDGKSGEHGHG